MGRNLVYGNMKDPKAKKPPGMPGGFLCNAGVDCNLHEPIMHELCDTFGSF